MISHRASESVLSKSLVMDSLVHKTGKRVALRRFPKAETIGNATTLFSLSLSFLPRISTFSQLLVL